jgi:tetratricopeptide (TPR) repeat protein
VNARGTPRRPGKGRTHSHGPARLHYVNTTVRRAVRAAVLAGIATCVAPTAMAADRILDLLTTEPGSVVIQFNCPMSYVSNYPLRSGDELRIELQPLPGCAAPNNLGESLPVPRDNPAGLVDLRLDQSLGSRRALTLHFARTVDFLIRPKAGLTGIEIVIARRAGRVAVEPAEAPPKPSRAPTRSLPAPEELDKLMAEARSAMQDRDYDAAIRLYTKLLEYPEHPGRPQAQEFIGLARERKGQLAQAKLEYQEYLRRYPDGADADAVKQRLAAIVTLEGATKPTAGSPDGSRWQINGAVSQEYRHDQNTLTSNGATSDGVGQQAVDSNVDLQLRHRGDVYDFRSRIYAGYLHDMQNAGAFGAEPLRLPQAYLELDNTASHWVTRLGRQSQSTGGVYGSYDGGYFGWLLTPGLRIGVAAGSPIETYAATFNHTRTFGNLSAEFLGVAPGLDLAAYAFQQNASGVLDAREVGAEARYYHNGHSLVGQLNYDVSFKVLNAATMLVSWALPDHWVLTGTADHRRSPFAATYNALIGQQATSLDELIQAVGIDAARALALDRTITSDTLTGGLQRPIGERLQWGFDLSMGRTGGTVASGGVPAVPPSGTAVSLSTQLTGGGWLTDGDMNTVGLAYTTRAGTKVASTYFNSRYPIGTSFRIGPRLQLSHTNGSDPTTGTSAGWSASPSLLADWRFRYGLVQFESGYERATFDASLPPGVPIDPNNPSAATVNQSTKRLWFSLGYNVSF